MGEAGQSPALSRNCCAVYPQSQITRLERACREHLSRIGGGDGRRYDGTSLTPFL